MKRGVRLRNRADIIRHYERLLLAGLDDDDDRVTIDSIQALAELARHPERQRGGQGKTVAQYVKDRDRKLARQRVYQQIRADKPALIERWRSEGKKIGKKIGKKNVTLACAKLAAETLGISVRVAVREGRFGESKRRPGRK
jgi:hypothetical protein